MSAESEHIEEKQYTLRDFLDEKAPKGEWFWLQRYPRVNGKVVDVILDCDYGGNGGFYKNGLYILKRDYGYRVYELTYVRGMLGTYVIETSMNGKFDKKGKVISGIVNCFGLGIMPLDEDYLSELFESYIEHFTTSDDRPDPWKWDKVIKKEILNEGLPVGLAE